MHFFMALYHGVMRTAVVPVGCYVRWW